MRRFRRSRCWQDITVLLYGAKLAAVCATVWVAPWTLNEWLTD